MEFMAGVLVALMVATLVPGAIKIACKERINWRLARTCTVALGVLFTAMIFVLNAMGEAAHDFWLWAIALILSVSAVGGVYAKTWVDHRDDIAVAQGAE